MKTLFLSVLIIFLGTDEIFGQTFELKENPEPSYKLKGEIQTDEIFNTDKYYSINDISSLMESNFIVKNFKIDPKLKDKILFYKRPADGWDDPGLGDKFKEKRFNAFLDSIWQKNSFNLVLTKRFQLDDSFYDMNTGKFTVDLKTSLYNSSYLITDLMGYDPDYGYREEYNSKIPFYYKYSGNYYSREDVYVYKGINILLNSNLESMTVFPVSSFKISFELDEKRAELICEKRAKIVIYIFSESNMKEKVRILNLDYNNEIVGSKGNQKTRNRNPVAKSLIIHELPLKIKGIVAEVFLSNRYENDEYFLSFDNMN